MSDTILIAPIDASRLRRIGQYWQTRIYDTKKFFGYFAKIHLLTNDSAEERDFFVSKNTPFVRTTTIVDNATYHVTLKPDASRIGTSVTLTWLRNHFPALQNPLGNVDFDQPFKIPLKSNDQTIYGLDMPTFSGVSEQDSIGDIPATFDIIEGYGVSTLLDGETANVTGYWQIRELGDGSFGQWEIVNSQYRSFLDAYFLAYYLIEPVILQIDYDATYNTPHYNVVNAEYTTGSVCAGIARIQGLETSDIVPW